MSLCLQVRNNKYWKNASGIEAFKFSIYVCIPLAASFFFGNLEYMKEQNKKERAAQLLESKPARESNQLKPDEMEKYILERRKERLLEKN